MKRNVWKYNESKYIMNVKWKYMKGQYESEILENEDESMWR